MPKRAPDWWLSAWDEYGHSFDTGRIVPITTGILLTPDNEPAVAVSVAGETPITLTPDTVVHFRERLNWAVDEHQQLIRADQATDNADDDQNARSKAPLTSEIQRKAQRKALALIEAKKPTNRIELATRLAAIEQRLNDIIEQLDGLRAQVAEIVQDRR